MVSRYLALSLELLAIALLSTTAPAQVTTADLLGTISDTDQKRLPGAVIVLENLETHEEKKTLTSADGEFVFNLLNPGHYGVQVVASGFQSLRLSQIELAAGDRLRRNLQLNPGASNQTVEVSAESTSLATDSATTSHSVTGSSVQDLPLSERNYSNLLRLTAGVNAGPPNGLTSGARPNDRRQSSSISIQGQTEATNNQLIDGMDNNERYTATIGVHPSVESIAEVRVVSNTPPAELGRAAGGTINIISKSGTDNLHGTLFEYFRNAALNAYPYQFGANNDKPALNFHQFGGSLGGPLRRQRTFFFTDAESYRSIRGQTPSKLTVPTLYEQQNPGDFSDIGGSVLTSSEIDTAGLNYFKLYPEPNTSANTYVGAQKKRQNSLTTDSRIDHLFNTRNQFFARVSLNRVSTFTPGIFPSTTVAGISVDPGGSLSTFSGTAQDNAINSLLNYVHIFTPNLMLELKAGYLFVDVASYPLNYGTRVNSALGQTNVNYSQFTSGLAPIVVTTAAPLGGAGFYDPVHNTDNSFQYQGALNWSRGPHNLKLGAALIRRQVTNAQNSYGAGYWIFSSLENLLRGSFTYLTRNSTLADQHYRSWEPSAYVQDDWRATPWLTLNMGIRYDLFTPYTEILNRISNLDPQTATIVVAGENGVSRTAGVRTDYTNLAPRFGFAATLGSGLVLHGGFGLSFFPANYTNYTGLKNQPFTSSFGPCSSSSCDASYARFSSGLPLPTASSATNPTGAIPFVMNPDFRNGYVEQINLNLQKELGAGNVFTAAYAGLLGRHIPQMILDINAPPPNTSSSYNSLRPYYSSLPNVTSIGGTWSKGSSSYNSLQLSFERRYRRGLSFAANYTLAHGVDDAVDYSNQGGDGYASVPSQIAFRDRSSGDLDIRHRIALFGTLALPFGNSLQGWRGAAGRGWHLNAVEVWSTGLPFTVVNSSNVSQTNPGSSGTDRPNQSGSGRLAEPSVSRYFDISDFTAQTKGTLGTAGRNSLYGPGYRQLDFSAFKTFHAFSDAEIQFRAECFNVLNQANFGQPNATLNGANFGALTSLSNSYESRHFQLAMRFGF